MVFISDESFMVYHHVIHVADILNLFSVIDQFSLFRKIFLNENQHFMLKNIGRKLISIDQNDSNNNNYLIVIIINKELEKEITK